MSNAGECGHISAVIGVGEAVDVVCVSRATAVVVVGGVGNFVAIPSGYLVGVSDSGMMRFLVG